MRRVKTEDERFDARKMFEAIKQISIDKTGQLIQVYDHPENIQLWRNCFRRLNDSLKASGKMLTVVGRTESKVVSNGRRFTELWVRFKVNPAAIDRNDWAINESRVIPGIDSDGKILCWYWDAEARTTQADYRWKLLDWKMDLAEKICISGPGWSTEIRVWSSCVEIIKHERGQIRFNCDVCMTRSEIRRRIWSLSIGEEIVVDCNRLAAYRCVERQRKRMRETSRKFRFVTTDNPNQTRVKRVADKPVFDVDNWPAGEIRQFQGHAGARHNLLRSLNKQFMQQVADAAIYETEEFDGQKFTIKRIR